MDQIMNEWFGEDFISEVAADLDAVFAKINKYQPDLFLNLAPFAAEWAGDYLRRKGADQDERNRVAEKLLHFLDRGVGLDRRYDDHNENEVRALDLHLVSNESMEWCRGFVAKYSDEKIVEILANWVKHNASLAR
jgi:hypothetical protein